MACDACDEWLTARILRSFHELTSSSRNVGCTVATAPGRPPARQVGGTVGYSSGPVAVYVGCDRRRQSCENVGRVSLYVLPRLYPCLYLIRVFKVRCVSFFQRATNTQILVVVKRPVCDSRLSFASNSPTRRLTLHSGLSMADVLGKSLSPSQHFYTRPAPTVS